VILYGPILIAGQPEDNLPRIKPWWSFQMVTKG